MTQTSISRGLTLQQLFGANAFQDADKLVIQKSSLLGLTPRPDNTAESLLVALLITALDSFQGVITDENNRPITDENNRPITFDNSEAYELLKIINWRVYESNRNSFRYINNQLVIFSYAKV